jgi:hypothetical protein
MVDEQDKHVHTNNAIIFHHLSSSVTFFLDAQFTHIRKWRCWVDAPGQMEPCGPEAEFIH